VKFGVLILASHRFVLLPFPQTFGARAEITPRIAKAGYSVVCADLRGYCDLSKPDPRRICAKYSARLGVRKGDGAAEAAAAAGDETPLAAESEPVEDAYSFRLRRHS
jgi:hypothetical protein